MNHENKEALNLLKTAKGQIEAVIRMTEDQRYCIDISTQIQAIQSLLKKANLTILKNHLNTCVIESINDGSSTDKIDEIMMLLDKYIK
ncbi:MAG: transcriptional regulator [Tenericutes bacterium HGW-Tenericutes-2]|jgi:DNA-binding FrmR family transcriptional regulator|nr:MAG: transcriptional regulator [Tenericutes bacterium HGW-Tenericutes-2]